MKLSKYFTLKEVTKSETAVRKGIDNTPTDEIISQLKNTCETIMDVIREKYGKPIRVTSGYRCVELNKAIGGSSRSQHCALNGDAAIDFEFYDMEMDLEEVFRWITEESKLPFDQCIAEFLPHGWIHISYSSDGGNRGKITRAEKVDGKTKYIQLGNADWL
jgi:zinc D-Ala-D-Ala carboxypeptidase